MEPSVRQRGRSTSKTVQEQLPSQQSTSGKAGFRLKYVILFLCLLFTAIFLGTYFLLGAIGIGYDTLSSGILPSNLKGHFAKGDEIDLSKPKDDLPAKAKPSLKQPNSKALPLPTIVWWTDKLFPHFQGQNTVKIECEPHQGGLGTCLVTTDKNVLSDPLARGVMFYGSDFRAYEAPLPRQPWHEWALLHEESPLNNQIFSHDVMMSQFNHTSTFRRESHYPITTQHINNLEYFTERKPFPLNVKNQHREKLAPIVYIQTHCNVPSDRDRYVKELMKYIDVDSYGKCLNNKKLPESLRDPVESMEAKEFHDFIARYKFHLAFENGICEDYITEKLIRPLHVGSVPIYRGSPSVKDWMPNDHSFILADNFDSPQKLAEFIKGLDKNDKEYLRYLEFKDKGIDNELLRDTMAKRVWGVNEWRKPSFINAFECYLCGRIVERLEAEQAHERDPSAPLLPPSMANGNHVGCPEPTVSFGDISGVARGEDIHFWKEDYWGSKDQAVALKRMIDRGATDSSKLFEELQKMFAEGLLESG
ncbi:alpha-(1,3)-fucosyltransferase 11-like [Patiria miniata]|uniref:Fucosyltransferase n=1 Tax=Patiria miniata TaxID=46514 RepID=A0A914AD92_PATMI|nr:alpha-(1,3)-fucosyltransferase 11-like [Patiria miniata]